MKRIISLFALFAFVLLPAVAAFAQYGDEAPSDLPAILNYWPLALAALFLVITFFSTAFTVKQQTAVLIERFGKFNRKAEAGLRFKIPFIESRSRPKSLRVEQSIVPVETKTKDNTFVTIKVAIQHQVENPVKAHYELTDPEAQMKSYVFDVVRAQVPDMTIDEVFANKEKLAAAIKTTLSDKMTAYGYKIIDAPVIDTDPAEKVKEAMNEVVKQERLRMAATEQGEAAKILVVKAAEAKKDQDKLHGEGVAAQREAIIKGLQKSIEDFQTAVKGTTPHEVMNLVTLIQYLDALTKIGDNARHTLFLSHSPGGLADIRQQIEHAVLVGGEVSRASASHEERELAATA